MQLWGATAFVPGEARSKNSSREHCSEAGLVLGLERWARPSPSSIQSVCVVRRADRFAEFRLDVLSGTWRFAEKAERTRCINTVHNIEFVPGFIGIAGGTARAAIEAFERT
jgi:hypothetical protein